MNIEIPQPGQVRTGPTSQPGSMQAAGAPWAAAGNVGGVVQDLGDKAMQFLIKQQRIKNVQMANELEIGANELFAEFENEMRRNPNPDAWLPDWQARLEAFQKQRMPGDLAPEQKALLGDRFAEFQSRSTMRVAEMATIAGIDQARRSGQLAMEQAMDQGRHDDARRIASEGYEAGLFDKPTYDETIYRIDQSATASEIEVMIEEDPGTTRYDLEARNEDGSWVNFPELPEVRRKQLIRQADEKESEYRREENDYLEHALDNGFLTDEDIDGAAYLTDLDKERWKAAREASDPPSSEAHSAAWDLLFQQRADFEDPSISDEQYAKYWNDTRAAVGKMIPTRFQGDINQEMSYRSPANRSARRAKTADGNGTKGWTASDLQTEAYAKIQRTLKSGGLGPIEDVPPGEAEIAHDKAARLRGKIRMTIEEIAKKGIDETSWTHVSDELDRLSMGAISAQILDGAEEPMDRFIPEPRPIPVQDPAGHELLPNHDPNEGRDRLR